MLAGMAIPLLSLARLHDLRLMTRAISRLNRRAFGARSWSFETSGVLRLTAIAGIALALAGCAKGKGMAGFQMPPVPVEVAEARPQVVRDQLRAIGGIEAQEII